MEILLILVATIEIIIACIALYLFYSLVKSSKQIIATEKEINQIQNNIANEILSMTLPNAKLKDR